MKKTTLLTRNIFRVVLVLSFAMLLRNSELHAQVTIGSGQVPDGNALLDLKNGDDGISTKGLLLPRVKLSSTALAAPLTAHVAGMTVYNTEPAGTGDTKVTAGIYYNDGKKWVKIDPSSLQVADDDGVIGNEVTGVNSYGGLILTGTGTNADPLELGINYGGVTTQHLADNSVTTGKIANGTILAEDLSSMGATAGGQVLTWNGTTWVPTTPADEKGWVLEGNTATATSFLGTTNNQPLQFKVNNEKAGYIASGSSSSVSFGYQALNSVTGSNNVALGHQAGTAITTGISNIAIGNSTLKVNTTGHMNIAIGNGALAKTTGGGNVQIGSGLSNIASGSYNIAIGHDAIVPDGDANEQLALGRLVFGTGMNATTGKLGIGTQAPITRLHISGSSYTSTNQYVGGRVRIGTSASAMATAGTTPGSGLEVVASSSESGGESGGDISIHAYKGLLQSSGGTVGVEGLVPTLNFYTARGTFDAPTNCAAGENIGSIIFWPRISSAFNGQVARMDVYRVSGTSTKISFGATTIGGSTTWSNLSDRRLKTDITPIKYGLSDVMKLQPVNYVMKDNPETPHIGFIAQDVKAIIPEVVVGEEGDLEKKEVLSLSYAAFTPVLAKAIQEQQSIIEEQQKMIDILVKRIEALESK